MANNRKDIIVKVNEGFSSNDMETVFFLCTPDVKWNMVGEKLLHGVEEVRAFMGAHPGEPPTIALDNIIAEGDWASCDGVMEMAAKPGETPERYGFNDVYRFTGDDRIAEIRSYIVRLKNDD